MATDPARERSGGKLYGRLINGDRGGYPGHASWRKYLKLAHGYPPPTSMASSATRRTSSAHLYASLLIASGASDIQVADQIGHSNRASILAAMNQAASRLHAYEDGGYGLR